MTSNRLPILATEIRSAHEAAATATKTALDRAREAGKKLIEAKELLGHGKWLPWLKDVGINPRTAQRYMQLAQIPDAKYVTVSHLTLTEALCEAALDPVTELVNEIIAYMTPMSMPERRKFANDYLTFVAEVAKKKHGMIITFSIGNA
jgi:hypothetical protein